MLCDGNWIAHTIEISIILLKLYEIWKNIHIKFIFKP